MAGLVYLVGAGPGDPGLLTLRAVECLREADFVLYDYLTSPRALAFAPAHAETVCANELPGEHPQRWPHIHQRIIDEAKKGKVVVHLKGGDPMIFGRGGEEAQALREAGIPYEIVPGVTAALAASAYAEIPLTHRAHASAVALITGHEHPAKANSRLDWDALARFPGTLAIYMGVGRVGIIARELIARGKSPDTLAALVHQASTGEQKTTLATLATVEERVRESGITAPSVMLVGPVIGLKPALSWFEAKPLFGMRVLVTRPREQAQEFARRLELLGAIAEVLPAVAIHPPTDWTPVDAAIERLGNGQYDWLIFTSTNGVAAFFGRLRNLGRDARTIGSTRLAAIGTATAESLAAFHLVPDLVPTDDMRSEHLIELLSEKCRGKRVLLARAAQGRELLREQLAAIAKVDAITVYEQKSAIDGSSDVFERLRDGQIDVVTLTSPNIARAFLAACTEPIRQRFRDRSTILLGNSQRLVDALNQEGFPAILSPDPTMEGLIASLSQLAHVFVGRPS